MSLLHNQIFDNDKTAYQEYGKNHNHEIEIFVYKSSDWRPKKIDESRNHEETRCSSKGRGYYKYDEIDFESAACYGE